MGTFLGEKSTEFSVWMSVSGNDALEKLKGIYDETAAEMGIETKSANDLWFQSMNYADANEIANVTQAKLTARRPCLCAGGGRGGRRGGRPRWTCCLGSGITDSGGGGRRFGEYGLPRTLKRPTRTSRAYYLGEVVNTGVDNGYSEVREIGDGDMHFGWTLGRFFVCGFTSVYEDENGDPVFIKTLGDQIQLWFELEQDIDCLNGRDALSICEDTNGFDESFGISRTNLGRGAMITRHTDYQNAVGEPSCSPTISPPSPPAARTPPCSSLRKATTRVALDYEIKDQSNKLAPQYGNYRIAFNFSVRNGNCMVYPFDVATGAELTNTAVTENGFYLDLALSRYLDINVKRETLAEGATGLTEDVRFNRPARDGEQYTEEGIYTITVSNRYTGQQTVKQIYVGTNKILLAHMVTGLSIEGSPRADRQGRADRGGRNDYRHDRRLRRRGI